MTDPSPKDRGSSDDSAGNDPVEPAPPDGEHGREHGSDEEIDESSDESFPASDAPQWWSGGPDDHK
ncbi:MAG TPA: hypothetical protein VMU64_00795 [Acidimicrobiales bacterium]|nr:hypothetical protein [Acidimicrobiales bacterium]